MNQTIHRIIFKLTNLLFILFYFTLKYINRKIVQFAF